MYPEEDFRDLRDFTEWQQSRRGKGEFERKGRENAVLVGSRHSGPQLRPISGMRHEQDSFNARRSLEEEDEDEDTDDSATIGHVYPTRQHDMRRPKQERDRDDTSDDENDGGIFGHRIPSRQHYSPRSEPRRAHNDFIDSAAASPHNAVARGNLETLIVGQHNTINPFKRKGKLLDLPMFVGNGMKTKNKVNVIPDTGATLNVISRKFLKDTNLEALVRLSGDDFSKGISLKLADGSMMSTLGQLNIPCSFPDAPGKVMQVLFHVCDKSADNIRVLLGKRFLEITRTLTVFSHRMIERHVGFRSIPRVMRIATRNSGPRSQLRILIDSKPCLASPDIGSEIDLFNTSFAKELNVTVKSLVSDDPAEIQYANGRYERILGKAFVDVSIAKDTSKLQSKGPGSAISTTDDEESDTNHFSSCGTSRHDSNMTRNIESEVTLSRQQTFYLVKGLANNIILSQAFIYSIDAYNTYKYEFVESNAPDGRDALNGIFFTGRAGRSAPQTPTTQAELNAALNKVTQRYITEKRKVDRKIESAKRGSAKRRFEADKEALKRDHDRDHRRIQEQYDDAMAQKQSRRR